ncbi:MAG: iron-sulfur cluster repair di-iron protein [Clostridia bacterium]|nr:iron-sulfur cluster repair di-iron protein [Clostridia bacterium]
MKEKTIGEIVADDYRAAAVFESYGIDFCCGGNITVEEACQQKSVNTNEVADKLAAILNNQQGTSVDFKSWPLDLLADYIQKKHHRYVEEKTPILKQYLAKVCMAHGDGHPELFKIKEEFDASAGQLAMHMKKEELLLFPFIRKMVQAKSSRQPLPQAPFGNVENPIQNMIHEHDTEGDRFKKISALSDNYSVPADGCNTYMITYAMLKEFEDDLHLHIHLENNILFPKAIELEKEFIEN